MLKIRSLIASLLLVGLLMTSCGKEIIYIEKEPDGSGYENLDPVVRALIDDLGKRMFASYIDDVSYNTDSRILPAAENTIEITISGSGSPWNLRAVEVYPNEEEIAFTATVSNNTQTEITFPANFKNDIIVWELQIQRQEYISETWEYFGFYVQLCYDDEMVYEIQDVEHNIVNADTESINIRLTKQNVMETEDDLIWLIVYEEGSSVIIDSKPYNLAMMTARIWIPLNINANENFNEIRTLQIYYHLNTSSEKHYLCTVIQRPGTEIPKAVVNGAKIADGGHHQIEAVRVVRTLQLDVGFWPGDEINVKISPVSHAAYKESEFEPIKVTANRNYDWKFDIEFPAARGLEYALGEEAGGWRADFENDIKGGINGAGAWAVSYQDEEGEWIPIWQVGQRAYYFGVSNKTTSMYKEGGEWIFKTQGVWPENSIKIRAGKLINKEIVDPTEEVIVNTISTTLNSWENAPAIVIPENTTGSRIPWKFQYWIDEIGEWRTWGAMDDSTSPEYGWEGKSNQVVQFGI